jgi:hypothetical protein
LHLLVKLYYKTNTVNWTWTCLVILPTTKFNNPSNNLILVLITLYKTIFNRRGNRVNTYTFWHWSYVSKKHNSSIYYRYLPDQAVSPKTLSLYKWIKHYQNCWHHLQESPFSVSTLM